MSRIRVDDLHKNWMEDPKYRREYEALAVEFSLVAALIEARTRAGLTQEQVAQRMKTTQAVIARLEGGGSKPSTRTLERYAEATGSRLKITLEPENAQPSPPRGTRVTRTFGHFSLKTKASPPRAHSLQALIGPACCSRRSTQPHPKRPRH